MTEAAVNSPSADSAAVGGELLRADLRHVVYALSDALDLVGVDDVAHGKRVGIMAAQCARAAGASQQAATFLFDLGLLHDIGVSTTTTHQHLLQEFHWDHSQVHCRVGHALLRDFAPLARMAEPILYHHTPWADLQTLGIDAQVANAANLIFLVDRVDTLAAPHYADGSLLMQVGAIRAQIGARANSFFAPHLVQQFMDASANDAFWFNLEQRPVQAFLQDMLDQGERYTATSAELMQLARIFACIVDAKSPFTAQHSLGVAQLARFIAQRMGLSASVCDKLEIAGLLHDLGKLRIPDEILDKPGPLDPRERKVMNAHAFETFQILRHIHGFEDIAPWAAYHHEEPGGTGYPFRLKGDELALPARILCVADVFQAMAQDRPYRPGCNGDQVRDFLLQRVREGRLQADIVAAATADMDQAMRLARPGAATGVQ